VKQSPPTLYLPIFQSLILPKAKQMLWEMNFLIPVCYPPIFLPKIRLRLRMLVDGALSVSFSGLFVFRPWTGNNPLRSCCTHSPNSVDNRWRWHLQQDDAAIFPSLQGVSKLGSTRTPCSLCMFRSVECYCFPCLPHHGTTSVTAPPQQDTTGCHPRHHPLMKECNES